MTEPTSAERAPVLVRVPRELREAVRAHAERSGMSMNEYIVRILQQADRMEAVMTDAAQPDSAHLADMVAAMNKQIEDDGGGEPAFGKFEPPLNVFADRQQGDIHLEMLKDTVLYDTQFQINPYQWPKNMSERLLAEPAPISFFQMPGGRGRHFTNLDVGGQLMWPKRMTVKQVAIQFDRLLDPAAMKQLSLEFRVGEKTYMNIPVTNMTEQKPGLRYTHPIANVPVPSVQNFGVYMSTGDKWLGETELRCELLTDMYREIQ